MYGDALAAVLVVVGCYLLSLLLPILTHSQLTHFVFAHFFVLSLLLPSFLSCLLASFLPLLSLLPGLFKSGRAARKEPFPSDMDL